MSDPASYGLEETPSGLRIRVYVVPRASSNSIVGAHNGELKIALAAPPVEGAANRALVEYLAKRLGVPKNAIRLISGETSRHKSLSIEGVDAQTAFLKLGLR